MEKLLKPMSSTRYIQIGDIPEARNFLDHIRDLGAVYGRGTIMFDQVAPTIPKYIITKERLDALRDTLTSYKSNDRDILLILYRGESYSIYVK